MVWLFGTIFERRREFGAAFDLLDQSDQFPHLLNPLLLSPKAVIRFEIDLLPIAPKPRIKPRHLPFPRIDPQPRPMHVLAVEEAIAVPVGRVVARRIVRNLDALPGVNFVGRYAGRFGLTGVIAFESAVRGIIRFYTRGLRHRYVFLV